MPASAREYDQNSFFVIQRNPISRSGVFQYTGKQIGPELEPEKIYNVWRPAAELADPECINSFKLLPFVDGHTMLGVGHTDALDKGVSGVIGEDVVFEEPELLANLKIFSAKTDNRIDSGIKEVSAGYRCRYEISSGIWNGQHYDAIQREIRGNHVALVPEGRCGPDVAVLDHLTMTFDAKEAITMPTLDEALKEIETLKSKVKVAQDEAEEMKKKACDAEEELKKKEAEDEEEEKAEKKAVDEEEEKKKAMDAEAEAKKDEKKEGMDAAAVARTVATQVSAALADARAAQALAAKLVPFVGVFDASEKTLAEVATYGVSKLEIPFTKGHEATALNAYLHNRQPATQGFTHSLDSANKTEGDPALNAYLG